jgi:hypothetical protein
MAMVLHDHACVARRGPAVLDLSVTPEFLTATQLLQDILEWPIAEQVIVRQRVGRLTRWRGSIVYVYAADVTIHPVVFDSIDRLHIATPPQSAAKHFVSTALEVWAAIRACDGPEQPPVQHEDLRRYLEDLGIATTEHALSSLEELVDTFTPVCDLETCTRCAPPLWRDPARAVFALPQCHTPARACSPRAQGRRVRRPPRSALSR